jgi:hypothetical protein
MHNYQDDWTGWAQETLIGSNEQQWIKDFELHRPVFFSIQDSVSSYKSNQHPVCSRAAKPHREKVIRVTYRNQEWHPFQKTTMATW